MENIHDLDEAVKISNEAWSVELEKENSKKKNFKTIYKKGGSNRTNANNNR